MMEKVLLSIAAVSVLCTVFSHAERQYRFVYDRMNMTEALKHCRKKYTDLASVNNIEDVKILNDTADTTEMVNGSGSSLPAWIGLYEDVNSWKWSLADKSFYKDGEAEFRKWWTDEPNNYNSGECCTQMYDNGYWNDISCEKPSAAVCIDVSGPNHTFVLNSTTMTWAAAQSYCRAQHTDLASVRNEAENKEIHKLVPRGQKVWIGLFRESWKWSDGTSSSFTYWKDGEPNNAGGQEACVAADMGQFGEWEDRNCDEAAAFICSDVPKVPKVPNVTKQVVRVRLDKKDSSLDLNDPVVMENLLEQFKQKLKDKGVPGNIKLSWKKQPDGKVFHKETKKKKNRIAKKDEL